jgi:hypothetical protein
LATGRRDRRAVATSSHEGEGHREGARGQADHEDPDTSL